MTKMRYISPAPFYSPSELIRSRYQHTKELPDWWNPPSKQTLCFHGARTCIVFACELLGIHPGDEVLIPPYNCGSEIDALLYAGIKVVMYRIDKRGRADLDDIAKRITSKTKAIYVTHYFGWPQDTIKLKQLCTDHDLRFIEDCALALFSQSDMSPVGVLCDASVYSLPKFLPVPDGGFLVFNSDVVPPAKMPGEPLSGDIFKASLPFFKRWFLSAFGSVPDTSSANNREMQISDMSETDECTGIPESYYYDPSRYHCTMSNTTHGMLKLLDAKAIVHSRRHNYRMLVEAITHSTPLQPFFDEMPDGVCPIMLPLLVENREAMVAWLKLRGIPAFPWWKGYHRKLDWSKFPESRYLKDHMLCLPVHQNLDDHHIKHMINCLLKWDMETK